MSPKWVTIEGIKVSSRFLKKVNGQWVRICRKCGQAKAPTRENYIFKFPNRDEMILDRICRKCREAILTISSNKRVCRKCGRGKPATNKYFLTNRGVLLYTCKICSHAPSILASKKWIKKHPRQAWESKVCSMAKGRARKYGFAYEEQTVNNLVISYIEGSLCPCCSTPMKGKNRWPSIDRIHSERGYVKDNVSIICYRCNVLKKNGTIFDFENIVRYMKS